MTLALINLGGNILDHLEKSDKRKSALANRFKTQPIQGEITATIPVVNQSVDSHLTDGQDITFLTAIQDILLKQNSSSIIISDKLVDRNLDITRLFGERPASVLGQVASLEGIADSG